MSEPLICDVCRWMGGDVATRWNDARLCAYCNAAHVRAWTELTKAMCTAVASAARQEKPGILSERQKIAVALRLRSRNWTPLKKNTHDWGYKAGLEDAARMIESGEV